LDGGVILPAAGPKGAGLAFFIDIMTGILGGGLFGSAIGSTGGCLERSSHCFIAVDISRFMPLEQFQDRLHHAMSEIVASEPGVRVAGQRAHETEKIRIEEGVPIPPEIVARLAKLADRIGVPLELKQTD
jgi:LDH2 family malate/lactate/ureidoglycolate dehydrogenase